MKLKNLFLYTCIAAFTGAAGFAEAQNANTIGYVGYIVNNTKHKFNRIEFNCHHMNKNGNVWKMAPTFLDNLADLHLFVVMAEKSDDPTSHPFCHLAYSGDGYGCEFNTEYVNDTVNWKATAQSDNLETKCVADQSPDGTHILFRIDPNINAK